MSGRWLDSLHKAYKLSLEVYEEYVFLAMDGVGHRKRNLDLVKQWREEREVKRRVAERIQRIRNNPDIYQPFKPVPEALEWLQLFTKDALRYPLLAVFAPSFCGKTEWAESLFSNPLKLLVGELQHFPDGVRELDRKFHDGVVLDDVRDLEFVSRHQEKLQGKYSSVVTFAETPSGQYSFTKDMYRLPMVITINQSTRNLHYLETHDFCSKKDNVRVLCFQGRPGEVPPTETLQLKA